MTLVWGNNLISVVAFDSAGNTATATETIFYTRHELDVFLKAPVYLGPKDSSLLNATVYNIGLSNETVDLFLLINGTVVDSTSIPTLVNGTSFTISHLWTPTVEATYNVTAYVPPVQGETNTGNNRASQVISVSELVEYRDEDKHFQILVPPGWTYESDVRHDTAIVEVVLYGPTEDEFTVNINVGSGSRPEVKETETYLIDAANEVINSFSSQFADFQVIQSPTCTTINKHAAVTYVAQYQYEDFTVEMKQTLIVSDELNHYGIITATALAKTYEKYESIFDAVSESFKITEPTPWYSELWYVWVIITVVATLAFYLIRRRARAIPPPTPPAPPVTAPPSKAPERIVEEEKKQAKYLGIASIICGLIGLFIFGTGLGMAGAFLGYSAIKQGSKIGYVGLVLGVIIFLLAMIAIWL